MFYPLFCMMLLTVAVGVAAFVTRVNSVRRRQLSPKYFLLMQGAQVPEGVQKTTRNFNNQFEVPVLFYVAGLLYVVYGVDNSGVGLAAAWAFVVLRVLHAAIHLSYNALVHRIAAFWGAVLAMLVMWVNLLVVLPRS